MGFNSAFKGLTVVLSRMFPHRDCIFQSQMMASVWVSCATTWSSDLSVIIWEIIAVKTRKKNYLIVWCPRFRLALASGDSREARNSADMFTPSIDPLFMLLYSMLAYFLTELSVGQQGFVFLVLANTRYSVRSWMRQYPPRHMCVWSHEILGHNRITRPRTSDWVWISQESLPAGKCDVPRLCARLAL